MILNPPEAKQSLGELVQKYKSVFKTFPLSYSDCIRLDESLTAQFEDGLFQQLRYTMGSSDNCVSVSVQTLMLMQRQHCKNGAQNKYFGLRC